MQIAYLDGTRFRRALLAAGAYLQGRRAEMNRINVFPVPDGDTGSNLSLTLHAIVTRLEGVTDRRVGEVAREAAEAAALGARGNSGMMLSQFLLGFADPLAGRDRIDASQLAQALQSGAKRLESSTDELREGTIVTVIRETALAGAGADTPDIAELLVLLVREARLSLERTPDLLPVLREAGVVDAGALGFVALLEGALGYMEGSSAPAPLSSEELEALPAAAALTPIDSATELYRYCTEALVRGERLPGEAAAKALLRPHGDSLLVVRIGDVLKVHLHTDRPEEVFSLLRNLGELVTHKAEDMQVQHETLERATHRRLTLARRPLGVVTDTACDLSDEILAAHGIQLVPLGIVTGEQTLLDRLEVSAVDFHRRLREENTLFTTSQPSPGAFVDAMTRAAVDAEELLVITLGSGLSGTFRSAQAATHTFRDAPVHLVDTQGVSLLQGLLVLKAAELAEVGWAAAEIVQEVARIRNQSGIFLTVDRFDRLVASGRVGASTAWVGSRLGVKPILSVDRQGKVQRAGQVVGKERLLPALLARLEEAIPSGARKVRFGVVHVGVPEAVDSIVRALRSRFGEVEILHAAATPVLATHVGLGAWAVAFMVED